MELLLLVVFSQDKSQLSLPKTTFTIAIKFRCIERKALTSTSFIALWPHSRVSVQVLHDAHTGMLPGYRESAICVQRFDDSLNSAIQTTYCNWLRSSSMHEPRDPPLKVVQCLLSFLVSFVSKRNGRTRKSAVLLGNSKKYAKRFEMAEHVGPIIRGIHPKII